MRRLLSRLISRWFPRLKAPASRPYGQAIAPQASLRSAEDTRLIRRSNKPCLMAIDPDPAVLNFITNIASPWYRVIGARDAGWARAWLLQHNDIVACVAGEKLATAQGVDLLDRCRIHEPRMLRILVTANIDAADPVRALLAGVAHRLVESPMCKENLGMAIDPMHLRAAASATVVRRPKLLAA